MTSWEPTPKLEPISALHGLELILPAVIYDSEKKVEFESESYRNFFVRAVLLGINHKKRLDIITGANVTTPPLEELPTALGHEDDDVPEDTEENVVRNLKEVHRVKLCAEQDALIKAEDARWGSVLGLVIVGLRQSEDGSPIETPTLHPCPDCRALVRDNPLVPREAVVVTWDPDTRIGEVNTVGSLVQTHASRQPRQMEDFKHVVDPTPDKQGLVQMVLGEIYANQNPLFLPEESPLYKTSRDFRNVVKAHQVSMEHSFGEA